MPNGRSLDAKYLYCIVQLIAYVCKKAAFLLSESEISSNCMWIFYSHFAFGPTNAITKIFSIRFLCEAIDVFSSSVMPKLEQDKNKFPNMPNCIQLQPMNYIAFEFIFMAISFIYAHSQSKQHSWICEKNRWKPSGEWNKTEHALCNCIKRS